MRVQHRPSEAESGPSRSRTPRFTVAIPLYNKARYVGAALGSVLAQTLQDFEVVVVDDGSTDGSPEVVAACGDPRVRLVRQPNSGVSVARNRAIELARGDWVVFLDADDWYHPRFLAAVADVQDAHPDVDFVATRYAEFDNDGRPAPQPWDVPAAAPPVERIGDLAQRWMKGPTLFTGSVAVRRNALDPLQPCFRPGEQFGEDLDLWFRLSERTPIVLVHAPLAGYRKAVAGSLSRTHAASELPPWVARLRERALQPGYDRSRRRSVLALIQQFHLSLAREFVAEGRRGAALACLARAAGAMDTPRWWLTAFMAACWPPALVRGYLQRGSAAAPPAEPVEPTLDMADLMEWASSKARPSTRLQAAGTP